MNDGVTRFKLDSVKFETLLCKIGGCWLSALLDVEEFRFFRRRLAGAGGTQGAILAKPGGGGGSDVDNACSSLNSTAKADSDFRLGIGQAPPSFDFGDSLACSLLALL